MDSDSSETEENPWPHLSEYVDFVSKSGQQILFVCKRCLPKETKIKVHASSLNNLKQHMRRVHESQYIRFEEIIRAGSTRGKPKRKIVEAENKNDDDSAASTSNPGKKIRQRSIGESFGIASTGSGVPQTKVDKCIVNFFISNMIPLHVVESETFDMLIKTLNPSKKTMSRRTLGRRIADEHTQLKQHLINLLGKTDWVATTADCWSVHNKSYLGMTVHWLDPVNRARMNAVLTCMRLKGHHTYDVLAQAMVDIHYEFHIDKKITRTTTDNGSNFVKAFVQFASESDILPELPSCDVESESEPGIASLLTPNPKDNVDQQLQFISVENVLNINTPSDATNQGNEMLFENFNTLPVHMRCAAHTFNLVASKDADAALQITIFKTPYRSAMAKARALWNQQSRSTVAADTIHAELGRRLVVPNTTRWNSLYDAIVVLNGILETKRPSLHRVMSLLKITTISDQDVTVMKEYAKVMAPVAIALDRIQGEAQAYLGSLLPTIAATILKLKHIKAKGLIHCTALANALINGIEKRFGPLLNDEHCQLAAGFHPKFRLIWLETYDSGRVNAVKKSMESKVEGALRQEVQENSKDSVSGGGSNGGSSDNEEDFFKSVTTQCKERPTRQNSLKTKAQSIVKMWLDTPSKDSLDDAAFFGDQILIKLFIKYNTAIPSSAAVERLFSTGKDILAPKRASLSDENFNMLMFMKGNMHIVPDS